MHLIDNTSSTAAPKVAFLEPEDMGPGSRVYEVNLAPEGRPVAPFKASRFTVDPGATTPVDIHEVREIWMVAEGAGELRYDNHATRAGPGDILYYDSMKPHKLHNDDDKQMVLFSVWWKPQ